MTELLQQHLGEEPLSKDPASILKALSRRRRPTPPAEKDKPPAKEAVAAELREGLLTGDWDGIRKYLSQLPPKFFCTRSWSLEWQVDSQSPSTTFTFPEPKLAASVVRQRFSDADVEAVGSIVALKTRATVGNRRIAWAAGVTLLAAAMAVAVFLVVRRRLGSRPIDAPKYQPPQELTPFSLLVLRPQASAGFDAPLSGPF